jgi:hypothetical protein
MFCLSSLLGMQIESAGWFWSQPMSETNKKPLSQTFNLELPVLGELKLENIEPVIRPKSTGPLEENVNEDLIRRLINRLKKM